MLFNAAAVADAVTLVFPFWPFSIVEMLKYVVAALLPPTVVWPCMSYTDILLSSISRMLVSISSDIENESYFCPAEVEIPAGTACSISYVKPVCYASERDIVRVLSSFVPLTVLFVSVLYVPPPSVSDVFFMNLTGSNGWNANIDSAFVS